jgi:CRP/FNR family transcriptional regulator, cyclic AMP receptor protein
MVETQVLATVPLFASLDESQLSQIAPLFQPRSVSAGTELVGQGASGYSFYVLTEGSAVVACDDMAIAQLGPGDFFGEAAILGDGRRGASVVITSPSQVLVMFGTEFRRLQQAQPAIAQAIEDADKQRHAETG